MCDSDRGSNRQFIKQCMHGGRWFFSPLVFVVDAKLAEREYTEFCLNPSSSPLHPDRDALFNSHTSKSQNKCSSLCDPLYLVVFGLVYHW